MLVAEQPLEDNVEVELTVLSVVLKEASIKGHVKEGFNGGTRGDDRVPPIIWHIASA
jgi:hypothetical protein